MLAIEKSEEHLILKYRPDGPMDWIFTNLRDGGNVLIKGTFRFTTEDLVDEQLAEIVKKPSSPGGQPSDYDDLLSQIERLNHKSDELMDLSRKTIDFYIGKSEGEYYKLDRQVLQTIRDFYIHKESDVSRKWFIAAKSISIFKRIDAIITRDIYIGGTVENTIPQDVFESLISGFPNTYEMLKYAESRVSVVLRSYFDGVVDSVAAYEKYMNKRVSAKGLSIRNKYQDSEVSKYTDILAKLESMLKNEDTYIEKEWQREILDIILLIYPKYIRVFQEAPVRDIYANSPRNIDFLLMDSNGHVDIIEIKRPHGQNLVTKGTYRDNFIPLRELSGTIMQVEKYILYLNKGGRAAERRLNRKFKSDLPKDMTFNIINPSGIVIMGREQGLTKEQAQDLEVIKRKYKSVIDIMTYDDLVRRVKFTLAQFQEYELTP